MERTAGALAGCALLGVVACEGGGTDPTSDADTLAEHLVVYAWFAADTVPAGEDAVLIMETANPTEQSVTLPWDCPLLRYEVRDLDGGLIEAPEPCIVVGAPYTTMNPPDRRSSVTVRTTDSNRRLDPEEALTLVEVVRIGLDPGTYVFRVGVKPPGQDGFAVSRDARLTVLPGD